MPKGQGMQIFPMGQGFPGDTEQGTNQRPFQTMMRTGKGPQTFIMGAKLGMNTDTDMQMGHNPKDVSSKGPQTHMSMRFGDLDGQNQDPSRPFNPKG